MACELSVNVDHVATVRQARGGVEPDPARAADLALAAGAIGITVHLREDRRHIQDHDVRSIRALTAGGRGRMDLEMALTEEMIGIALGVKPERASLVPEKRAELTTEGGLDLARLAPAMRPGIARLRDAGIAISLFLDPIPDLAPIARDCGAHVIEIHTGHYANAAAGAAASPGAAASKELERIAAAAAAFEKAGLAVHAGHGLSARNVGALLRAYPFTELSIGHSVIARAVEIGTAAAVRELLDAMRAA